MQQEILKMLERQKQLVEHQKATEKEMKELKGALSDYARSVHPKPTYAVSNISSTVTDGTEYVVITESLQNLQEKEQHLELFGSIDGDWKEIRHSLKYYRKGPVLTHIGGGYMLLDDCQICTDQEWLDIKAGKFGKFDRRHNFK